MQLASLIHHMERVWAENRDLADLHSTDTSQTAPIRKTERARKKRNTPDDQ